MSNSRLEQRPIDIAYYRSKRDEKSAGVSEILEKNIFSSVLRETYRRLIANARGEI